uniref:hypothetical protein n=1 Tax=Salinispora oceanensis TaxID=1050199 RepID=UPI0003A3F782
MKVPKSAQQWIAALARRIFNQPTGAAVRAQFTWVVTAIEAKSRPPPSISIRFVTTYWPSPISARELAPVLTLIAANTPRSVTQVLMPIDQVASRWACKW